jgi:hypothetical protein
MHLVLLVLGVLLTVLGAGAVLYGIPIYEFGFGNTLIIAGTTAMVGGLILIGIAQAARQLRRIAETLDLQPMAWTASAVEAAVRRPAPGQAPEPLVPELVVPEPLVPAPERTVEAAPPEPVIPVPERAREVPEPMAPVASAEPVAIPAPRRSLRDWIQYGGQRTVPPEEIPTPAPVRTPEPSRPSRVDLSALARAPERPVDATREDREPARRSFPSRRGPRPGASDAEATVFRSGVVEGMAYTLYTDGSIDAELPEGTARFESLDALRAHLAERS